jgi:aryl-alcohol dehydrogenase-like predicted oxidoreductase
MYSGGRSEEVTGRSLKKLGLRREETVIATKLYYPMGQIHILLFAICHRLFVIFSHGLRFFR